MDLAMLLERCKAGDELAWEALVRQFQARVFGIAFHYTGNAEDARDMAQEIFIRIYKHLDLCGDERMFVPWMIRISRNACIDHLRRKKARPTPSDVAVDEMIHLEAPGLNPEEHWMADARKQVIHHAFRKLTALSREAILLREILGLPLEEIASMLEIPLGTVKSRINRARIELADKVRALAANAVEPAPLEWP
jgi:RNA polymerase sigma-70 factor (ECF subfamily)